MSFFFKIAFYIDILALLAAFFVIISDYSRNPENTYNDSLKIITIGLCIWMMASYFLCKRGSKEIATIMAWIPAIPLILYALFVLAFIVLKPDMK